MYILTPAIMKAALIFLCLCVLRVDAACSFAACVTSTIPTTPSEACTYYTNYIDCLNGEKADCTDSTEDQASLALINTAITASTEAKALLDCSSAGGLTVSVFSVLLTLVVTFLKL